MSVPYKNWSGVYTYVAAAQSYPESLDELRRIVSTAPKIHAVGSRHCFNGIADSPVMISLAKMPMTVEVDRAASTVTINPGMRYHELGLALEEVGLALHNTASLPHITVGGAIATATHGSGDKLGNLASAVAALEIVASDGEVHRFARGDAEFPGTVVNVGALGVMTSVTLDVQPTYRMRQEVFLDLAWDVLYEHFDEIYRSGESVSIFSDYGDTVNELWIKTRISDQDDWQPRSEFFGARASTTRVHPVSHFDGTHCTEQMGIPGPWRERMPHFMVDAIGDAGDEMQTEYMVARSDAVAGIRGLKERVADLVRPYIFAGEVRSVAADDLWLSSAYQRETVCIHFATKADLAMPNEVIPVIEEVLAPFAPRPHWGKLYVATAEELAPRYPKMADFRALADRLDPRGAFRSPFLVEQVLGS